MAHKITLKFNSRIAIAHWEAFCRTHGLSYQPKLADQNIYSSNVLEVMLGDWGTETQENGCLPPNSFDELRIFPYKDEDAGKAIALMDSIQSKFGGSVVPQHSTLPLWGRTLPQEEPSKVAGPSPLDAINARRIVDKIRGDLEASVENLMYSSPRHSDEELRNVLTKMLQRAVDRKMVEKANVENMRIEHVTWADLYPRRRDRLRALFTRKVLRFNPVISGRPGTFLKMLGYKCERKMRYDREAFEALVADAMDTDQGTASLTDIVDEAMELGLFRMRYMSVLKVPYSYTVCDVTIQPSVPVENITLNIKVEKGDVIPQ